MEENHVDYLSKVLGHLKDENTFLDEMPLKKHLSKD